MAPLRPPPGAPIFHKAGVARERLEAVGLAHRRIRGVPNSNPGGWQSSGFKQLKKRFNDTLGNANMKVDERKSEIHGWKARRESRTIRCGAQQTQRGLKRFLGDNPLPL